MENTSSIIMRMSDQNIIAEIQKDGWYIEGVEKTTERCLAAVKQNGRVLKVIPAVFHTVDLCLEAVKQNASAIKCVSKRVLSLDICLEGVRRDGKIIAYSSYIPDKFRTKELYLEAIKQNGMALQYVPNIYKTKSFCMKAVMQNGLAIQFVPNSVLSKDFYLAAVKQSSLALKYVPSNSRSKALCIAAVNNNALALEYVPNRYKKLDLCNLAIHSNWEAFLHVPESMYTLDRCLEIFNLILSSYDSPSEMSYSDRDGIREIVNRLPVNINNDTQIINLERRLKARYFKEKLFDKGINKFITREFICYKEEEEEVKEFETFIEFYEYLDGNLKNVNLFDFDFEGIQLKNFELEGANISSTILISQNLYDDSFYAKNIREYAHNLGLIASSDNEVVEAISVLHDTDLFSDSTLNDNSCKMYYISDIHLNHKLFGAFPAHATKGELTLYIRNIVKRMVACASLLKYGDYLLIAGDISFNFEISTLFYTELVNLFKAEHYSPSHLVVVLGNHELWDFNLHGGANTQTISLDEIIQRYRDLFSNLGICFLQNELLLSNGTIISEEQLKSIEPDELKSICLYSSFIILGGIGFSGLNFEFNASCGIYRNTITSLDEDIEQTERFKLIYSKVRRVLCSDKVVVLTHMPKENWSKKEYNNNWIYVSGHTHRNDYCCDEEKTFYSDNQIGYHSTSIGLKHFSLARAYDIFRYYSDGIYIISREQYLDFNRGIEIKLTFNRIGKIHMLKNSKVYCFIFENADARKLYLLNGGKLNNLEYRDINYYFGRMSYYSDAVKGLFSGYNKALKSISNIIKTIGGTGKVHGCIVDIDFFNHILVDPMDGTITPYFAWSINARHEYCDIETLLLHQRKDLHDNYMKLLNNKSEGVKLLKGETNVESIDISRFVQDTQMYGPSRIMKSLQYLTEANVIRIWNDRIMNAHSRIED